MEKQRGIRILSIVALFVAVIGLSVAFAAMSRTLQINGTATMDTATWDIHFENLSNAALTGDAAVTTAPELKNENTVIGDFEVVLIKPGDSVTYTFDIVNNGTIDAKLSELVMAGLADKKLVCTSLADPKSTADETTVCGNLTYTLEYTDGGAVAAGDKLAAKSGDTATRKNVTLTLKYDGDTLPEDDVEITGLDITMVYNQD